MICALAGCGRSTDQQSADDEQWKASIAKAEQERVARESQMAAEAEHRREAEAAAQAKIEDQDRSIKQDQLTQTIKNAMYDPESARFRNVRLNLVGDALCGEINAKNKMGGYVGFKRFVVFHDAPLVEADDTRALFDAAYKAANCP